MKAATVLLVLIFASCAQCSWAECRPINKWSLCAGIITHDVDHDACESLYESKVALLNVTLQAISAGCKEAHAKYLCSTVYKPCGSPELTPPPQAVCDLHNSSCTALDLGIINSTSGGQYPHPVQCADTAAVFTYASQPVLRYPRCEQYTGAACKGVVDWNVYVPAALQQSDMEKQLVAGGFYQLVNNANRATCLSPMAKVLCSRAFPKCSTPYKLAAPTEFLFPNPLTGGATALPVYFAGLASKAVCNEAFNTASCAPFLPRLPFTCSTQFALAMQCNASVATLDEDDPATLTDLFPTASTIYSSNGVYFTSAANTAPLGKDVSAQVAVKCPAPLMQVYGDQEGLNGGSCQVPCPSLLYTHDQYDQIDRLTLGFSFVSFVFTTWMLLTYLLFKRTRKSVAMMIETVALWFVTTFLFFAIAAQYSSDPRVYSVYGKMQCVDAVTPRRDSYCKFQAVVMVICGLLGSNYWFVQSVEIFLQLMLRSKHWSTEAQRRKDIILHCWGSGYPILVAIIALGKNSLGNTSVGVAWCFILDDGLSWGIFYAPIFAQCVIGAILMVFIMRALFQSGKAAGTHKRKGWWRVYVRPVMFIATFLFVWTFVFAYRLYGVQHETEFNNKGKEFVTCLLSGQGTQDTCPRPKPSFGLYVLLHLVIAGTGVWLMLVYFTWDMVMMWYYLFTCQTHEFSATNTDNSQTSGKDNSRGASKRNLNTTARESSENSKSTEMVAKENKKTGLKYKATQPAVGDARAGVVMGPQMTGLPDLDTQTGDVVRFQMQDGESTVHIDRSQSSEPLNVTTENPTAAGDAE